MQAQTRERRLPEQLLLGRVAKQRVEPSNMSEIGSTQAAAAHEQSIHEATAKRSATLLSKPQPPIQAKRCANLLLTTSSPHAATVKCSHGEESRKVQRAGMRVRDWWCCCWPDMLLQKRQATYAS